MLHPQKMLGNNVIFCFRNEWNHWSTSYYLGWLFWIGTLNILVKITTERVQWKILICFCCTRTSAIEFEPMCFTTANVFLAEAFSCGMFKTWSNKFILPNEYLDKLAWWFDTIWTGFDDVSSICWKWIYTTTIWSFVSRPWKVQSSN